MGIDTLGVERQRRLRVHQPRRAAQRDSLEIGGFARAQGTDERGVRAELDLAEAVVWQSLVELPDQVGKPLLLAVVAMLGIGLRT